MIYNLNGFTAIPSFIMPNKAVADIALMKNGNPVAAILLDRHAAMPLPYMVLKYDDVKLNPYSWAPVTDHFPAVLCDTCLMGYARYQRTVNRIANTSGIKMPISGHYRHAITQCWICQHEILVFAWPGEIPQGEILPHTIQHRFVKSANKKIWVNVCSHCNGVQGNYYLHDLPDAPMYGIPTADYQNDILNIFARYIKSTAKLPDSRN